MTSAPRLVIAEPPARYLPQPPLVVDCSTLAGVLFQEPWQLEAGARLAGRTLYAPFILESEICSVALKKARRGAAEAAAAGLAMWADTRIELLRVDIADTFALAQRYQLSAYDAAYLWLAAELRCPLATFDEKLGRVAIEHLGALD